MYKTEDLTKSKDVNPWTYMRTKTGLSTSNQISQIELTNNRFSVVTKTGIKFYDRKNSEKSGSVTFKDSNCFKIREDDKMMVVGTNSGNILLKAIHGSTMTKTSIIRSFKAHDGLVNSVEYLWKFNPIQNEVASVGEDGALVICDIFEARLKKKFVQSKVALKGLCILKSDPNVVATGSSDHFIRIYDIEAHDCPIITIDTEKEINCLMFPHDNIEMILAICDSQIKVYDTICARKNKDIKPLKVCTPHFSSITDAKIANNLNTLEKVIITCSFDRMVKVTSLVDFSEIYKFEFTSDLISLRISDNCEYLVVAGNEIETNKGYVYVKELCYPKEKESVDVGTQYKNILSEVISKYDLKVITHRVNENSKLSRFDKLVRKSKFRQAWLYAITKREMRNDPVIIKSVIAKFVSLRVLNRVIVNRTPKQLDQTLELVRLHITGPYRKHFQILYEAIISKYPRIPFENNECYYIQCAIDRLIQTARQGEQLKFKIKSVLDLH